MWGKHVTVAQLPRHSLYPFPLPSPCLTSGAGEGVWAPKTVPIVIMSPVTAAPKNGFHKN